MVAHTSRLCAPITTYRTRTRRPSNHAERHVQGRFITAGSRSLVGARYSFGMSVIWSGGRSLATGDGSASTNFPSGSGSEAGVGRSRNRSIGVVFFHVFISHRVFDMSGGVHKSASPAWVGRRWERMVEPTFSPTSSRRLLQGVVRPRRRLCIVPAAGRCRCHLSRRSNPG